MMDPPKTPRTRSPKENTQPGCSPLDTSHFPLLPPHSPEPPVDPRPSPKICWFRLCHPIHRDQARRENRAGSSPKYLGCATSGAPTAGCSHSWRWSQGRVRLRHLPTSPGNPFPCSSHSTDPATPHSHPSGVSTSKHPKKQQKGRKESSRPPLQLSQPQYVPLSTPHSQGKKTKKSQELNTNQKKKYRETPHGNLQNIPCRQSLGNWFW